jgi:hypothetical protein
MVTTKHRKELHPQERILEERSTGKMNFPLLLKNIPMVLFNKYIIYIYCILYIVGGLYSTNLYSQFDMTKCHY